MLVIDDNRAIHDDFRKILSPAASTVAALDATEEALFGNATESVEQMRFEVDSAYQGQEGALLVKKAIEEGRPYAMAFVDMRMPPGWDGVETIGKILEIDPEIQIVICTAYSEYSWSGMLEKLGHRDGLLILKKPFDTVEASQLAQALTEKWWLQQQSKQKMEKLESRVAARTHELAKSLSLLNATFESIADGIVAVDLSGKIVSYNTKFADTWQFPAGMLARRDAAETRAHTAGQVKDTAKFLQRIEELQADPETEGFDVIELKNGRIFERYVFPQRIDRKCVGTVINWRNVTERKRAEEAVKESEDRFSNAFKHAPIGMALVSSEGRWLRVNRALCDLVGYSEAELLTRTFQDITHPDDLKIDLGNMRRLLAMEIRFYQMEKRYFHKRGHLITVLLNVSLVHDGQNQPRYFISQIQDITERKQAEISTLEFSKLTQRLSSANSAREAFGIISEVSKDLFGWDAFWINLYSAESDLIYSGFTVDTINGQQVAEEWGDPTTPTDLFRRIVTGHGELIRRDQPASPLPGTVSFGNAARPSAVLLFAPIRSQDRAVGVLSVQSYTPNAYNEQDLKTLQTMADLCGGAFERIWANEALRKTEAQLFQSQKLETVGKLAGGIAHEFNSILTAIIGQSELLLGDLPAGSPLATNATEISKAAGRAATLTRQLLAYGRKQFLQPETLDLNQILASMEGMFRNLMGSDVDTQIIPAVGLQALKADAGQIEHVIMNIIIINARDAMPSGGKLTLETANVTFDEQSVGRDLELKPGDYVMLAVTDAGTGMSEEVKARIFEPFFTSKGVGQGTGLGLSTCYGIIKQSGGHISVYSELGRGTTFKIYLPQVEPQTKIPAQRLDSPDLPRGTETILLVEDDPALREMAATLLGRLGYKVLAAADGIEALRLKEQTGIGHIDLLFTDVVMPHMSGKELGDRVQALSPHTRILLTSAYTENAFLHQGVLDKGVALLQKPFTPSALARKLRDVLDQPSAPNQKTP